MKILRKNVLVVTALSAATLLPGARLTAADDPAVLAADQNFVQAMAKSDTAALDKLLDANFQWISANGKIESGKLVLARVGERAVDAGYPATTGTPNTRHHDYAQVEVVQTDSGGMHVLRVWVKRPAGWRALVYQEVQSLDAPPKTTPSAGQDCQNPCKSVGYTPKNETEQAIITAYEGLETSAMTHDAANWDAHTGEEFIAASSYSDRLLDKPTRLGELKRANMAGLAPTPLVSAKLFVFGDAAVLRSHHVANQAKPLEVTRVFVKRDGRWVEVVSYQTAVQGGGAS
jgi:Domain of unknown function (DUF4440)